MKTASNQTRQKCMRFIRKGFHGMLASIFKNAGFEVRTALLDDPENGLRKKYLHRPTCLSTGLI